MSSGVSKDIVLDAIKAELETMAASARDHAFSSAYPVSGYLRNRTADRILDSLTRDPVNAEALADLLPGGEI